jgi:para-nitrobenzyl esterase
MLTAAVLATPTLWYPRSLRAQAAPKLFTTTLPPYVELETAQGRVRGGHSRGALAFKGIPYAGPVAGTARFKEAPPPQSWSGVRDALQLGPPSMQGPGTTYGENEPAYSENCLVLNVWTPAVKDGHKRPVMVYSHGGGFTSGSGGSKDVDGSRLAATYDVVVVTTNHRLGLLGYLYLGELGGEEYATSGNQGMLDIVAALRWVKGNIEAFGGDPGNVMICGESGGGAKVGTLLAMPAAHGLFHKASIESGPSLRRHTKEEATEVARRVLSGLGLGPHDLHKLADVPVESLVTMQVEREHGEGALTKPSNSSAPALSGSPIQPVVDGHILPQHPFDPVASPLSARIPLMVGSNKDEATFFEREHPQVFHMDEATLTSRVRAVLGDETERALATYRKVYPQASPSELYIAMATAYIMGADTTTLAERKAAQPAPVYLYRYDYQSNTPIAGTDWTLRAGHATEIPTKFYNYDIKALEGDGTGVREASTNFSALWTSFARTGHPSGKGIPEWPRYDTKRRATMLINSNCQIVDDPDRQTRELWASLHRPSRT